MIIMVIHTTVNDLCTCLRLFGTVAMAMVVAGDTCVQNIVAIPTTVNTMYMCLMLDLYTPIKFHICTYIHF